MDQHDAQRFGIARAREALRLAVDAQGAAGQRLVARQDLHQRGLARAVLAEQAVHAPRRQRKAHAMQHLHGAEGFHHAVELDGHAALGCHGIRHGATPRALSVSCIASTPAPTRPPCVPSGVYWISRCRVDSASERW
ncbi:hypothetical protein D9M72_603680 [compost metagenome]